MSQSEKKSYHKNSAGAGENTKPAVDVKTVVEALQGLGLIRLPHPTRAVLIRLIATMNKQDGRCFPCRETLAAGIGMSLGAVKRAIVDATRRGILAAEQGKRGGRFRSNAYVVRFDVLTAAFQASEAAVMTARMHAVPGGARGAGVQDLHPADGATVAQHAEPRTVAQHAEPLTIECRTIEDSSPLSPPPASRPGEPRVPESMCLEDALKANPGLKARCFKTAITCWKRQRGSKPLPDLELLWEGFEDEWTLEHRKKLPDWPKVFLKLVMRVGDKRWCRQSPTAARAETAVKGDSGDVRSGWSGGASPQARCGTVAAEKWEREPEKPAQPLRVHSTEDERRDPGMSDGEAKNNGRNPSRDWGDVPRPRAGGAFRDRDAAEKAAEHARVDAKLGDWMALLNGEAETVIKRAAAARPRRQWTMAELAAMGAEASDIDPGALTGLPGAFVAGPVSAEQRARPSREPNPEISVHAGRGRVVPASQPEGAI